MKRFLVALALIASACSSQGLESTGLVGADPTPAPALALKADLEPFTLAGSGSVASEGFRLAGGSTLFHLTTAASAVASVVLVDVEGKSAPWTLFEASHSDVRLLGVGTGTFRFEVSSAGSWSVQVEQPREEDAVPLQTLSGSGRGIFGPYELEPGTTLSITTSGSGSFGVDLLSPTGHLRERVAQASGSLQTSKTLTSGAGVSFVRVEAEGPWNIRRE